MSFLRSRGGKQCALHSWRGASSFGLFAILAGLGACSPERPALPSGPAKRVILISCDTLRADHLGCYGYSRPTTPSLDALAREAIVFDNAWSSAPLTGPSVSSLLTGYTPDEVGATPTNREVMPESVPTLAEAVQKAGFVTAAVVSNGVLRRPPKSMGNIGVQQGFDTYDDDMNAKEVNRDLLERTAPACTDAALAWLERHKQGDDARFFLWVHYQDPHGPYMPPRDVAKLFERDHAQETELPVGKNNSGNGQIPYYQLVGNERRPGQYVDRYDAEIRNFDDNLGRLLAWLKVNGLWDDTLIVFTGDHGEQLGDHGYYFAHGETLWRELVRVPLLVKPPKTLAATALGGKPRETALAMHLDFSPTLAQALGIAIPPNRGSSWLGASLPENRVCAQFLGPLRNPGRRLGITDGRWRIITVAEAPPMLFDLAQDPGELHDLAPAKPEMVLELQKRYVQFMSHGGRPMVEGTMTATKGLRGLGYTEGDVDEH
jgi:arylsulfatase A-like enzyme